MIRATDLFALDRGVAARRRCGASHAVAAVSQTSLIPHTREELSQIQVACYQIAALFQTARH